MSLRSIKKSFLPTDTREHFFFCQTFKAELLSENTKVEGPIRKTYYMTVDKTGKRVLVVDDSSMMRVIVCDMMERLGHESIEARNGIDAVAFAQRHNPDLVVLDLIMPGESGFDTLSKLRGMEQFRTTPIIILTTEDNEEFAAKAKEGGANDFLTKPVDLDQLEEKTRLYLDS